MIKSQNVITNNNLIIKHRDIVLYLDKDTSTLVSKHSLKYSNFIKLGKYPRDNNWFEDTYKGKYLKSKYKKTGYDLGHLTPSHITTYDSLLNHYSFSMFNQAPQLAHFNREGWKNLEISVENLISKYKSDAVIITGVIYFNLNLKYLPKSRIKIPSHFYKIVFISGKTFCWIGSNIDGKINSTNLEDLNNLFKLAKINLIIK